MRARDSDRWPRLIAGLGLGFIGAATLTPIPSQSAASAATSLACLICGDHGGVDVFVNVLLFIPFALGLRASGVPFRRVLAIGILLSATVELLQLTVIPGRDASLSDVVTNTLGSLVGASLGSMAGTLVHPDRNHAMGLAAVAAGLWLAIQLLSGALLQPWIPATPLRVKWARTVPGRAPFDGIVTASAVSGARVSSGAVLTTSEARTRLLGDSVLLQATALSGRPTDYWIPVLELLGPHGALTALQLGNRSVVFHPPSQAYRLRLRGPALRLPRALPSIPGVQLKLAGGERYKTLWVTLWRGEDRYSQSLALSPSFGWSLIVPVDYAYGPEVHTLTALWLAGLLLPLGYWSARSGLSLPGSLAGFAGLLGAGLGAIPWLLGYPWVHWSEWVAGAGGIGIGWAYQRIGAYFGGRCDSPSIRESCSS